MPPVVNASLWSLATAYSVRLFANAARGDVDLEFNKTSSDALRVSNPLRTV